MSCSYCRQQREDLLRLRWFELVLCGNEAILEDGNMVTFLEIPADYPSIEVHGTSLRMAPSSMMRQALGESPRGKSLPYPNAKLQHMDVADVGVRRPTSALAYPF